MASAMRRSISVPALFPFGHSRLEDEAGGRVGEQGERVHFQTTNQPTFFCFIFLFNLRLFCFIHCLQNISGVLANFLKCLPQETLLRQ